MNSNLKLLPAALLVAVLALAGCGGGSDDMTTPPEPTEPPPPTCMDGYALDQSTNTCVETADGAKASEDAKAAAAMARALHGVLGTDAGVPTVATDATAFTAATTDKSSQSIRLEGAMLSTLGLTASTTEGLTDYYQLASGTFDQAESDAFGGIEQMEHDGNAPDGDRNDFVTTGKYRGIDGTFRCTADTCTSQDGHPTGTEANWLFKPNDPMARVMGNQIQWGWWLTETDDAVSAVNRFRHDATASTDLTDSAGLGGLGSGMASYEGEATGQYAVTGDSGAFTATASLTATFGNAVIPLSGSIHTFMGADGEARDWMIELKEIADATTSGVGDYDGGTTVWDGYEMSGTWNADMYNGTGTVAPDVILGDFRAQNHGGRMAGVFGAQHQDE